jgi:hypothetical protein
MMRLPAFVSEHPVETFLAGALLLAMLFGSADHHAADVASGQAGPKLAIAQKL